MNCVKNLLMVLRNRTFNVLQDQVRYASGSKSVGGPRTKPRGQGSKFQGIKVAVGTKALQGQILFEQIKFNYLPGLNVEIAPYGRKVAPRNKWKNLRAIKAGTLVVSSEKADLDYNNPYVAKNFTYGEGQPLYKHYFHIIPPTQHKRFKLVRQV